MMISEEALYAAAPEAAEKFLSALPDREDCVHDFSPDFEARMATLLRRQRRRRHWRALLAAAAVLGALAAGLSVGAGDRTDCQIYWSQTDGELRYVIRLEHTTTRPFQDAQLRCVPEGFILVRGSTSEIRGERSLAYRRGEDASFTLMQTQGEDLVGSKGTASARALRWRSTAAWACWWKRRWTAQKKTCCGRTGPTSSPSMGRACPPKSCWRLPGM